MGSTRRQVALRDDLARFCTLLAGRGDIGQGVRPGPVTGGWLRMGGTGTPAAAGNVLLAGDAAGLINPLQGEGIAPAMVSGRLPAGRAGHRMAAAQPGGRAGGSPSLTPSPQVRPQAGARLRGR